MGSFLSTVGIIALVVIVLLGVVTYTSFSYDKDENGKTNLSLFWGAIKINEKDQKVNILGDLVAVDGKNNSVKVGDIVKVDGDSEMVNVDNGKILVDGKANLIKVKKDLVLEVNEDHVVIENNFDSKIISLVSALKKKEDKKLKVEGKKVGEDEVYIHLESKDGTKVEVNINFES